MAPGSRKKRKRVGRGRPSGHGKTSGRGTKGQQSRSGYSRKPGFEGGQMPLRLRVPKRGFTSRNKIMYQIVNLEDLERVGSESIQPESLKKAGLIRDVLAPIKILGSGQVKKGFKVLADRFSASARGGIEAAGGTCEVRDLKSILKTAGAAR
ncbi:MAG: 50S ribosomal protein L15 [Spirochaetales bacterium]|nr:50S ribosomal protein L15 [Spirochaetales bacterium]